MSDYVNLLGAEDVARAGRSIQSAAEEMRRAASSIDETMSRSRQFMDDWLERLRGIIEGSVIE